MSRTTRTLLLPLAVLAAACSTGAGETATADTPGGNAAVSRDGAAAGTPGAVEGEALAYFAGGCFWGVEYFLEKLDGVHAVESGYMGGHIENPSYVEVTGHGTGHLETVRVRYDPSKVSYEALAQRFFEIHDPTQANGQGPDIGPQYLSAIFVANDEERSVVKRLISALKTRGYAVVTEIKPTVEFYTAEDYHQDYYVRHESKPYCHTPVDRFGDGA